MRAIRTEAELRTVIGTQPLGLAARSQPRRHGFAVSVGGMFVAAGNAPPEAAAAIDDAVNADCRDRP